MEPVQKSEQEWKEALTLEEYRVLREAGTEAPFSGKYVDATEDGVYRCRACGAALFSSEKKLDSSESGPGLHGWPSFSDPLVAEHIGTRPDDSHGMHRTEVFCKRCGSHLGHVFDEVVKDEKRAHYCINSLALDLERTDPS